jgi:hypothetical protein
VNHPRVRGLALALAGAVAASVTPCSRAAAQRSLFAPYPELRADVIAASRTAATLGAGVELPLGSYVRLGLDANGGALRADSGTAFVGRVDAIGRFLLDPFREVPVALSFGAGITVPVLRHTGPLRPLLVGVVDLEGRRRGGWTPALQLGLGGGLRLGLVLRHSPRLAR